MKESQEQIPGLIPEIDVEANRAHARLSRFVGELNEALDSSDSNIFDAFDSAASRMQNGLSPEELIKLDGLMEKVWPPRVS